MDSERIRQQIRDNATEIARLDSRIKETHAQRSKSPKKMQEWKEACAEFHSRYAGLAFPGGYQGNVLERILSGDPRAMETAVCFLEVRPYFFGRATCSKIFCESAGEHHFRPTKLRV